MKRNFTYRLGVVAVLGSGILVGVGKAGGSPADVMPARAFGYVEFSGLEPVVAELKGSRLMGMVAGNVEFKKFMASDQGKKMEGGKTVVELMLGMDLWTAFGKLFGGEVAVALYPQAGSDELAFLLFVRPAEGAVLEKPLQVLGAFFEKVDGGGDGVAIYRQKGKGGEAAVVAAGEGWMAVSTRRDLLDGCVALVAGEKTDAGPLSGMENFGKMVEEMGDGHLGRMFVNSDLISEFAGGRMGIPAKQEEPMVSLLFGGLLELAANSPYAGVALDYDGDGEVVVSLGVSGSPEELGEAHRTLFAAAGEGVPPVSGVDGLVGGICLHRDIAAWYASREELMGPAALPGFDKFESDIGNLLPGKDFGEDVLPMLGKNVRLVSARQDYGHLKGAKPGVQLPGFALVIDLAEPDEAADILQVTFQSLMTVMNFQAAQEGRTPSVVEADLHNGVKYTAVRNLERPEGESVAMAYNFLPAAARVGDKFILSSSLELCKDLIDELQDAGASKPGDNDVEMAFEMGPILGLMEANRAHLVAGGIKKGKSAGEAKSEVDAMMEAMGFIESMKLESGRNGEGYRVRVAAKLK